VSLSAGNIKTCKLKNNSSICRFSCYHCTMIERNIAPVLRQLARQYPVITLTGPRQSGKTTLAKTCFADRTYLTLEDPDTRRYAADDPRGFLAQYAQGAIFDEIQRAPELASYLQGLVDADPQPGRFILTGSHQFELMTQVSQSLAGRTAVLRLLPFTLAEVQRLRGGAPSLDLAQNLLTGFYPRIHDQGLNPSQALADYFATYVQRDLRQLAAVQDLQRFERFVRLCAGRTGQLLNLSSLGNDAGVSHATARAWIDLLQSSYLVHLLPPWFAKTGKRLVKAPKLYFYDVGLACWLLGLRSAEQVARDPLWGSLFENFVIMEAMKDRLNAGESAEMYFYRDSEGNEVDLLLPTGSKMHAIEIKAGATVNPDYFKGLKSFAAHHPAALASGSIVFGGTQSQNRSDWPVHSWLQLETKAVN
jgi:predicted AAA+ superfamily ATPase